jgi:hypothetical protein
MRALSEFLSEEETKVIAILDRQDWSAQLAMT